VQELLIRAQRIDRRVLYVILILAVAVPDLYKVVTGKIMALPVHTYSSTQGLYDTIEKLPRDKLVMVAADWGFASQGENEPQTIAVLRHLMSRKQKFITWTTNPGINTYYMDEILMKLAKEYGLQYGTDWLNCGYRYMTYDQQHVFIVPLMGDICGTLKSDYFGRPLRDYPIMHGVRNLAQVSLVYSIGADAFYEKWLGLAQKQYGIKVGFGSTNVMVPQALPFFASGQLCGLLEGMNGGAQYENLVGHKANATRGMSSQSLAHLTIVLFVILGNLGYFAQRAKARREREAKPTRESA